MTGTHIHGAPNVGTPVRTFSRDEIDQTGVSTTEDLVATIPQNFNEFRAEGGRSIGGPQLSQLNVDYATGNRPTRARTTVNAHIDRRPKSRRIRSGACC